MQPLVGDRVVVRYRLGGDAPADWRPAPNPAVAGPSQSDVTGVLLDDGDPMILERDGEPVRLPRSAITSVRVLSAVTARNSEIREVLAALAAAEPAGESEIVAGWLCRTDVDGAAAPALPVQTGAGPAGLISVSDWYRRRGLVPVIAAVDRLLGRSAPGVRPTGGEIAVLTAGPDHTDAATVADLPVVTATVRGRPMLIAAVPADDVEAGLRLRQASFGLHHWYLPGEIATP